MVGVEIQWVLVEHGDCDNKLTKLKNQFNSFNNRALRKHGLDSEA